MIREFSLHWGCLRKKVSVHGAQMETDSTLAVWTNSFSKFSDSSLFSGKKVIPN